MEKQGDCGSGETMTNSPAVISKGFCLIAAFVKYVECYRTKILQQMLCKPLLSSAQDFLPLLPTVSRNMPTALVKI